MKTLFSFTSFRLKPHLYLGIESSESISTGLSWINITENQIKKKTQVAIARLGMRLNVNTTNGKGLSGCLSQKSLQLILNLLQFQPTPKWPWPWQKNMEKDFTTSHLCSGCWFTLWKYHFLKAENWGYAQFAFIKWSNASGCLWRKEKVKRELKQDKYVLVF